MRVLLRLIGYALTFRTRIVLAWVSLIIATIFAIAVPRLLGTAIDEALQTGSTSRLWQLGGLIILVTTGRGALQYLNLYMGESIGHSVSYLLRDALYHKLQNLSFAFHDRQHTGDLMSKATIDVDMTRMFINTALVGSLRTIFLVTGASTMMLLMDWRLALASLFFVPVIAFRTARVSLRMRRMWRSVQSEMGHMTTVLQENLTGMKVVKAFGAEHHEESKFQIRAENVYNQIYAVERIRSSNAAIMQVIFWASTGVILWLGGRVVVEGRLTAGELAQFILYASLLVQPVRMLGQMVSTFTRAMGSGERIFEILDKTSPVEESKTARPLSTVTGKVEFRDVSFTYSGEPSLSKLTLDVDPGQVVAILGPPGSGKTTMANLIARFYDVTEGQILIDGTDIRTVTLNSLRSAVGIVQQDVFLFSTTIAQNIAYGHPEATEQDIVNAAKIAHIHEEITEFPDGYQTMVGERGVTLSGGQRQRLSIARTLITNPPILIFDDSTSSVDAHTESLIQTSMFEITKGRTTFIIAHRLTATKLADLVIVLDHGHLSQIGTPTELIAREGFYKHTAELQHSIMPRNGTVNDSSETSRKDLF